MEATGGNSSVAVINSRVVGGDAVQCKDGAHLDIWNGNQYIFR